MESNLANHGYELISEIGSGKYSRCYLCWSTKYQTDFVCKVIHVGDQDVKEKFKEVYKQELDILSNFIHPNIISVFDAFEEGDDFVLVLEYCHNGSLQEKVSIPRPLDPAILVNYARQILGALSYMHKNNVAHHDIKPSNMFLDKYGRIKLADFGIAQSFHINDEKSCIFGGTIAFMAPEQFKKLPYSEFQSDIWSFEVTLYSLAFGRLPFTGNNVKEVISSICTGAFSMPRHCPNEIKNLILHSLDINTATRYTADQLLECLNTSSSSIPLIPRPRITPQRSVPIMKQLVHSSLKQLQPIVIPKRFRRGSGH